VTSATMTLEIETGTVIVISKMTGFVTSSRDPRSRKSHRTQILYPFREHRMKR